MEGGQMDVIINVITNKRKTLVNPIIPTHITK